LSRTHRDALVTALAGGALIGLLAAALFPRGFQFTKYPWAADQYLSGTLQADRILDFSPFYLYLNVLAAALLGRGNELTAAQNFLLVSLHVAATAAAAGLLVLLMGRFFPRWIALSGGAAFLLLRGVVVYAAVLEPEAFLLLFLVAFLLFTLGASRRDAVLAGASLALALSVRPSVLPLLGAVPLYVGLARPAGWLRRTALVLAPSVFVLAALAVRNGLVAGSWSPLGMGSGFVFYEGSNPLSRGRSAVYPPVVGELKQEILGHPDNPHLTYRLIAERSAGRPLTTSEANAYWRGKAVSFLADHPRLGLRRTAEKALMIAHSYRLHDVAPAQRYDDRLETRYVPVFPFALLSVLAALGVVASAREWRRRLLVYALLVSQVGVMLVFYVSERQRLAAVPALLFFACAGTAYVASLRGRARVAALTVAGLVAVVLSVPNWWVREDRHLWHAQRTSDSAWARAVAERDGGSLAEAKRAAARTYASAPWLRDSSRPSGLPFPSESFDVRALELTDSRARSPSLRFDRARLLLAAARLDEADSAFAELISERRHFDRLFMQSSRPEYYLAVVAAARGERDRALRLLEQALEAAPGDPFVLAELAALTGDARYRMRMIRYFSLVDAAFLVGLAQLRNGQPEEAVENLATTVERAPELRRARIYLAAALGAAGRTDEAVRVYMSATEHRTDPTLLEERIVPIFRAAAERAPTDATARYQYGLVLAQFGRFDESLVALRGAYGVEPRPEIRAAVAEVERMRARAGDG
jgi:tetratricopeptide (TPR) repeat protein